MNKPFPKQTKEFIEYKSDLILEEIKSLTSDFSIKELNVIIKGKNMGVNTENINIINPNKIKSLTGKKMRVVVESSKNCFITDLEDYFEDKGRINQVICNICNRNNNTFLLSLRKILSYNSHKRSQMLNKITFAIKLFIKYGVSFYFVSLSDDKFFLRSREDKEALIRMLLKDYSG